VFRTAAPPFRLATAPDHVPRPQPPQLVFRTAAPPFRLATAPDHVPRPQPPQLVFRTAAPPFRLATAPDLSLLDTCTLLMTSFNMHDSLASRPEHGEFAACCDTK
jgi:hypothetical protein